MLDFVLCHPPMSLPDTPLVGIALLSAILQKNNYTCTIVDINIDLYQSGIYDKQLWDTQFAKYTVRSSFNIEYLKIQDFVENYVNSVIEMCPKHIGIGVFTKSNEYVAEKMCELLREKAPTIKIILGGIFCDQIGPDFLSRGLIDFYINGPAEDAILDIAANNTYDRPGINNLNKSVVPFDGLPQPDYSSLTLSKYKSNGLYITGSRGCPYKCTFCGVSARWTKFQLRNIQEIANEIEFHIINNGVKKFFFTDSLVNGNMKYFRLLCFEMRKINEKYNNELSIEWFMSIRNQYQMTPMDFDALIGVGISTVKLGVESGSPQVLSHINKSHTIPDVFYYLTQLQRVNIKCDLLFFTGYPTESDSDFQLSKNLLRDMVKFQSIINFVRVTPMCVEENTTLHDIGYPLGVTPIGINRYEEFRQLIFDLGFNIRHDQLISNLVKENVAAINNDLSKGSKIESNYFSRTKSQ